MTNDPLAPTVQLLALNNLRKANIIESLVADRFAHLPAPVNPIGGHRSYPAPGVQAQLDKFLKAAEDYKTQLQCKTLEDLQQLQDEAVEMRAKQNQFLQEQRESKIFFHANNALADLFYWAKMEEWTIAEAIALSLGKSPKIVNWKSVQPHQLTSPFARRYEELLELAHRAVRWQKLWNPVKPYLFLAWADRVEIPYPSELGTAVRQFVANETIWQRDLGLASSSHALAGSAEPISPSFDKSPASAAVDNINFAPASPNQWRPICEQLALQYLKQKPSPTVAMVATRVLNEFEQLYEASDLRVFGRGQKIPDHATIIRQLAGIKRRASAAEKALRRTLGVPSDILRPSR